MMTFRSRIPSKLGLALAWLICFALFGLQIALFREFTIDDAFITFRYVKQWVAGNGLVFNIGERVEGYSNFLWVVLLASLHALGVDLVLASKALGVLLGVVTLLLTAALVGNGWRGVGASILLAVSAPFGVWAVAGLETMLFACLFAASALAFAREEEAGRGWLSGPLFALLALSRFEGLMFGLLASIVRGVRLWREGKPVQPHDWLRLALWLAPIAVHMAWRLSYYGYPMPNTVYAKSMGLHPRAFVEGAYYLYTSVLALGGALPLLVAGLVAVLLQPSVRFLYLLLAVLGYAAFTFVGGGDWMPAQRFLAHILPAAAVLTYCGLAWIARQISAQRQHLLLAGLVGIQVAILSLGVAETRILKHLQKPTERTRYIREHLKPGEVVAVTEAGQISYELPLDVYVLDMFGLTDAHIAHLKPQFPSGLLGHGDVFGKWDVDYVIARAPRFVHLHAAVDEQGNLISGNTSNRLLISDPRFKARCRMLTYPETSGFFECVW